MNFKVTLEVEDLSDPFDSEPWAEVEYVSAESEEQALSIASDRVRGRFPGAELFILKTAIHRQVV